MDRRSGLDPAAVLRLVEREVWRSVQAAGPRAREKRGAGARAAILHCLPVLRLCECVWEGRRFDE